MNDEILNEEIEIVLENEEEVLEIEENVSTGEEAVLENEENLEMDVQDDLLLEESFEDSGEEVIEQDDEILETEDIETDQNEEELENEEDSSLEENGEESVSHNSVSGNGIDFEDFTNSEYFVNAEDLLYSMRVMSSGEESSFLSSDINNLSTTDTLLFLIFCLLLGHFIHSVFKASHWFRKL